jgi:hypothetical protein
VHGADGRRGNASCGVDEEAALRGDGDEVVAELRVVIRATEKEITLTPSFTAASSLA